MNIKMLHIVRKLARHGGDSPLKKTLGKLRPHDIAETLLQLNLDERKRVIRALYAIERAGETLKEVAAPQLDDILADLSPYDIAMILHRLASDDARYLLDHVDEEHYQAILSQMPDDSRQQLEMILLYPKGSAGAIMNPRVAAFDSNLSIDEAISKVREKKREDSSLFYLYIVDEQRLVGVCALRELLIGEPQQKLAEIMKRDVLSVHSADDQEKATALASKYNLLAVPVIDDAGSLVGVITVDDIFEVIENEATEDIYNMAGLDLKDRVELPMMRKVGKRLPWMLFNLMTAFVSAWVVGLFKESIAKVVVLAVFMPVVSGLGGNSGIQALTVITRAIALGELTFNKAWHAIFKETGATLLVGLAIGALTALIGYLWIGNAYLGGVLFLSMVITHILAGVAGASVPLLLKKLGQDPALGSGVIVTMLIDVGGFFTFLSLATVFLKYLV